MKTGQTMEERVVRRLDVLIALQLEHRWNPDSVRSVKEQARKLSDLGLPVAEISSILGKRSNYISALLPGKSSGQRKRVKNV